ncbi:tetratricopeptide repeat protein [Prosthecobacter debontii]|nr:tetratricopeptide repeat protein [Prosthecobacter debontii]
MSWLSPLSGAGTKGQPEKDFRGQEMQVAALLREYPRAVSFTPLARDKEGEIRRLFMAVSPLLDRFNLPLDGLFEALQADAKKRLDAKKLTTIERARLAFFVHDYASACALALKAGDTAHQSKHRVVSEVVDALALAAYSAQEMRRFEDARRYLKVAAGETDPKVDLELWADIQASMANLAYLQNDFQFQLAVLREIHQQYSLALGPSHGKTLRYQNELAAALYDQKQDAAAEKEYQEILQRLEKQKNAPPDAILVVRKNLAKVLKSLKRDVDAEVQWRQVIAQLKDSYGGQHEKVIVARNSLAFCLNDQGRYADAEAELVSVMDLARKAYGNDAQATLTARHNLGAFYYDRGRYTEAATQYQILYENEKRVYGPDDPSTLTSYSFLGSCMNDTGKHAKAEEIFKHVLERQLATLPVDALETQATRNNLGIAYREQGKLKEAEEQYRIALSVRERVLGPDHERTLAVRNNLAVLYSSHPEMLGDARKREISELKATLAQLEAQYGRGHANTVPSRSNLASVLESLGQLPDAEKEYRDIHSILIGERGREHPETVKALMSVAINLMRQKRMNESEALFREGYGILEKVLEPEDDQMIVFRHNFVICLANNQKVMEAVQQAELVCQAIRSRPGSNAAMLASMENFIAQTRSTMRPEQNAVGSILQSLSSQGNLQVGTSIPVSGNTLPFQNQTPPEGTISRPLSVTPPTTNAVVPLPASP